MKTLKLQVVVFMAVAALLVCAAPKAQAEAPYLQEIVDGYLAGAYTSYVGIDTGSETIFPGDRGDELVWAQLFTLAELNLDAGSKLLAEVAGYEGINELHWYTTDSAMGDIVKSGIIFDGGDSKIDPETYFTPVGATYLGFKIVSKDGVTFFSESGRNADDAFQHFRVFEDPNYDGPGSKYIFGVEDLARSSSDRDYNDMVFAISKINAVPEPASMTLLGLGLMGVLGFARRKLVK